MTSYLLRAASCGLLVLGLVVFDRPQPTAASESRTFVACGSGQAFVGVVRAIRGDRKADADSFRAIAGENYSLKPAGGSLNVESSSRRVASVATQVPDPKMVCNFVPSAETTVLLAQGGVLPGPATAAVDAVLQYRTTHPPWPLGPAHAERANTTIRVQTQGRYEYVSIHDWAGDAPRLGGCTADEHYRVDPTTFAVLPYDSCLEGHAVLLPKLQDLPHR